MKELIEIQAALEVPKSQYNKFGGYNYRSCEDILEKVKPLLKEHGCILVISDEVVEIGGRVYIKATATLHKDKDAITVTGFAREDEHRKGMNSDQLTGATSSYARKYALNGLFCIDDAKDSDRTNEHDKGTQDASGRPQTQTQAKPQQQQTSNKPSGGMSEKQRKMLWALGCKIWTIDDNGEIKADHERVKRELEQRAKSLGFELGNATSKDASLLITMIKEMADQVDAPPGGDDIPF